MLLDRDVSTKRALETDTNMNSTHGIRHELAIAFSLPLFHLCSYLLDMNSQNFDSGSNLIEESESYLQNHDLLIGST
jgi:hypothetical protein